MYEETHTLWPRDLLAKHGDFKATRIMTYGYNSSLFERKDTTDMRSWSSGLIKALENLRNSDEVRCYLATAQDFLKL
jgi:hypothetical protein